MGVPCRELSQDPSLGSLPVCFLRRERNVKENFQDAMLCKVNQDHLRRLRGDGSPGMLGHTGHEAGGAVDGK